MPNSQDTEGSVSDETTAPMRQNMVIPTWQTQLLQSPVGAIILLLIGLAGGGGTATYIGGLNESQVQNVVRDTIQKELDTAKIREIVRDSVKEQFEESRSTEERMRAYEHGAINDKIKVIEARLEKLEK